MRRLVVFLLVAISLFGCSKQIVWNEPFEKDETLQVKEIFKKDDEVHYLKYDNGFEVEVFNSGSRNIIKDGKPILGIAENNTKSNESFIKEIR